MKSNINILKVIILVFVFTLFQLVQIVAQSEIKLNDSISYRARPDRIIQSDSFGLIYITNDTTSKMFEWLAPNMSDNFFTTYFGDYFLILKECCNIVPVKNDLSNFPSKWNPVYIYKNDYYVYSPSDWYFNTGYYITDSIIYKAETDPDNIYFILNYEQVNENVSEFKTIDFKGKRQQLKIEILDIEYGIFIWTFLNRKNEIEVRQLMQDSRFIKKLPMIVRDCLGNKCPSEFVFEEPEFDKLTNN